MTPLRRGIRVGTFRDAKYNRDDRGQVKGSGQWGKMGHWMGREFSDWADEKVLEMGHGSRTLGYAH